jgi:MFS family permease
MVAIFRGASVFPHNTVIFGTVLCASSMANEGQNEKFQLSDNDTSIPAQCTFESGLESAQPLQTSSSDIPDGGWRAWSVVAGGWCAMFVSVGWNNSAGVFQTIYENDKLRKHSPSAVGWIISLQTFFMFAFAPISGRLFDTYGPRYPMIAGAILHLVGVMMMSLSTEYYQFILAQSVCTGIGAGMIFFAASNTIATWFKQNRAFALGIASSGSATGGVVIP